MTAFIRGYGHEVFDRIDNGDLAVWGDDSYVLVDGDSFVAKRMYVKDDGKHMLALLDSGVGGFGNGDLLCTPLFESCIDDGLLIACQLRIIDKINDIPAAAKLLANLLKRAATYEPEKKQAPIVADGMQMDNIKDLVGKAADGETVLASGVTSEALAKWGSFLGVDLTVRDIEEIYQVVRVTNSPLLSGISNEDTCGIKTWAYAPPGSENFTIGDTFIAPADGIESLLESPSRSAR